MQKKAGDNFILSVVKKFVPNDKVKAEGSVELIINQSAESNVILELESRRIWLTDVYHCVFFFNDYVKEKIKESFIKRAVVNGMTVSSWRLKGSSVLP